MFFLIIKYLIRIFDVSLKKNSKRGFFRGSKLIRKQYSNISMKSTITEALGLKFGLTPIKRKPGPRSQT